MAWTSSGDWVASCGCSQARLKCSGPVLLGGACWKKGSASRLFSSVSSTRPLRPQEPSRSNPSWWVLGLCCWVYQASSSVFPGPVSKPVSRACCFADIIERLLIPPILQMTLSSRSHARTTVGEMGVLMARLAHLRLCPPGESPRSQAVWSHEQFY